MLVAIPCADVHVRHYLKCGITSNQHVDLIDKLDVTVSVWFSVIFSCKKHKEQSVSNSLPTFMPTSVESGLGIVEYSAVVERGVAELADPSPAIKKHETRGK